MKEVAIGVVATDIGRVLVAPQSIWWNYIKEKGVEINFLDQAKPMETPDPVTNLSGQLNTTHLDATEFINERGNEVYGSD
ncbi:hypothetical protein ACFX11_002778 [Malus domestica]